MERKKQVAPDDRLAVAERRVQKLERELHVLHTRLNQITTGRAWAAINFFQRVRYWSWYAPAGKRREKIRQLTERVLRKTGLYPIAARLRRLLPGTKPAPDAQYIDHDTTSIVDDSLGYDVICLPVIAWNSRFQRPQQMARRQAAAGHRVFYTSFGFHRGKTTRLSPCESNVYEMSLPGTPNTNVYQQLPSGDDVRRMVSAIDRLRRQRRIASAVVVVQLPFWTALAEKLRDKFGWPIVYDCMDDHSGFSTNCESMLGVEERTIAEADLVVVTSDVLEAKVRSKARRTALIRNACDYEHFAPVSPLHMEEGAVLDDTQSVAEHPTIGFYGAIAEWFDADLVANLAELRPRWRFELIGSTYTGDVSRLEKLPNVTLLGEKPYTDLPRCVAEWDAFIIPFKRIPLTEATNPVKAYEMLATGKPVVAVDLPELRPMARDGLLSLADDARAFAEALERELAADCDRRRKQRRGFATENTWQVRGEALDREIRELFSPASIIIVTYNNLHLNQGCLESVFRDTDWPNFEVIVVDNASNDGTAEWLAEEEARHPNLRVILNKENLGFAAANNQGLRVAHGESLCLLNNDTVVARGWLSTMIGHFRAMPKAGMIGPVSNMVGNEAKVPVGYSTIGDMPRWAAEYCRQHDGETIPMKMLGFFCVMFRREMYEKIGEMDERFGVGYFEDTDYCYRAKRDGFELCCARDAFVHHWQGASFRLLDKGAFAGIYRKNQQLFERKWGAESMAGAY